MDSEQTAERGLHIDSSNIRFSNSPARRTQVQQVQSPTKSIYPEYSAMASQMESIDSQTDFQHRTIDFFDDESDVEDGLPRAITTDDLVSESYSRSRSPAKRKQLPPSGQSFASRCEPKRVSMRALEPESEGYQRVDSTLNQQIPRPGTADTDSYAGSVDEFLPRKSHEDAKSTARLPSRNHIRTSGLGWKTSAHTAAHQSMYEDVRASSMYSDKIDQRLGVHQMAYEMLIQGMMNDQELMSSNRSPLRDQRASALPAALRTNDPRSPRDQLPANPSPDRTSCTNADPSRKKAHFVPPPIDVDSTRHSLPSDLVRTPYPYLASDIHRTNLHQSPLSKRDSPFAYPEYPDTLLILSIRKSNPHSGSRVTTVTIPSSHSSSVTRTNAKGFSQEHTVPSPPPFDDEALFLQIRTAYRTLSGAFLRIFSARSLTRISVRRSPTTRIGNVGTQPQCLSAHPDLTDTFPSSSEEKEEEEEEEGEKLMMELYLSPRRGRQRFTCVHWARRRLGSASGDGDPTAEPDAAVGSTRNRIDDNDDDDDDDDGDDDDTGPTGRRRAGDADGAIPVHYHHLVKRGEQPKGLEFIVSWSIWRIISVLISVVLLAVAASLLWVFLGTQSAPGPFVSAGFRGAGDRVGTGVLMGVMVLLVGLTGFAGWIGVSWLVM